MIRSLKKRPRSDNLINEKRASPHHAGRLIYLVALLIFAIAILNYLFGDMFFLRANGLVLKDQSVVSPAYVAEVQAVHVKEGQEVKKGQILVDLRSLEMLERLADLAAQRARLVADSVNFRIRSDTVASLLPLARKRENEAAKVVGKFDRLSQAGLARASTYDDALTANFNAQQDRVKLSSQRKTLEKELATLMQARLQAEQALEKLRETYGDGIVRSPVSGAVGATIPSIGNVFRTGEPVLSIYSGEAYVLTYLPRRYLFSIEKGQKVTVSDGRDSVPGVLVEMLPVTDQLPKEFQNTFRPTDRNQLGKIRLLKPSPFPLHEKVSITARYF